MCRKQHHCWPLMLSLLASLISACGGGRPDAVSGAFTQEPSEAIACAEVMDETQLMSENGLREIMAKITAMGYRSPGSDANAASIRYLKALLDGIPGISTRLEGFELDKWEPLPTAANGAGRDLLAAGKLTLINDDDSRSELSTAGAIPYSLSTGEAGQTAPLVYLPADTELTEDAVAGKLVIRDMPIGSLPYAGFAALSYYMTTSFIPELLDNYERPYLATDSVVGDELVLAGQLGARGVIYVWNVPHFQIAAHYDPHRGTHYRLPAIQVGVDEGEILKQAAANGASANIAVLGERGPGTAEQLFATLPGQSDERIILNANVDGTTWVQENAVAGFIGLMHYFARIPAQCRPRTIELALTDAHMHLAKDGVRRYADQLDEEFDDGGVAFVLVAEHFGTRELLPQARTDGGPGEQVEYTGKAEPVGWFVGENPSLIATIIAAVQNRGLERTIVLRGQDVPNTARVPVHCSFGGLGTQFHSRLIPTAAIISGPWSLWTPSFGEAAVDFSRMRRQLLAVGDVVLGLDDLPLALLHGAYPAERLLRSAGFPSCEHHDPPEQAPE